MSQVTRYWDRSFRVYGPEGFSEQQVADIVGLIESPTKIEPSTNASSSTLGGRTRLLAGGVEGIGDVVLKSYSRGGALRFFLGRFHMRLAQSRCRKEYKMLENVRDLGVRSPEPIAYVEKGAFWYVAWLVTRRIPGARTLVEIALDDEQAALNYARDAARQIGMLIRNRIFHVDLHPGNVVVSGDGEVYILDFDKAHLYRGRLNDLRDCYLRRWRRAVIKHRLPEVLSEGVSLELRNNYE